MIKEKRGLLDTKKINVEKDWDVEISKDCLTGPLFVDELSDDFLERLEGLFTGIIREVASLYQTRESEEKTVSNFFKIDSKYRNVILKRIVSVYYRDPIREKSLKNDYLCIFQ